MIKVTKKYFRVWSIFAINSFQSQLVVRWAVALFLIAKLLRFGVFGFFIIVLLSKTSSLAGYSLTQTLFFFLTFNLIDTLVQSLFREVYRFRPAVVTGTFDFYLIKPYNPLFRSLLSGPDVIDLVLLIPLTLVTIYFFNILHVSDPLNIFLYITLLVAGVIIATSFHILVLSLAILTTEIDHAILVYRDITGMGRVPVDIYREPIRGLITFALPVGIMMSFPVKALLGILSWQLAIYAIFFSAVFFYLSLKVWNFSLKEYSSASS